MDAVRHMLKLSKFELNAGNPVEAKLQGERAISTASRNRQFAHYLPIAEHRLAMALKTLKQHKAAREHFERARIAFATYYPGNRIGYAILLRDYGFFLANELRDYDHGRQKVVEARNILRNTFPEKKAKRAKLELLVTESFLRRIRLRTNRYDRRALADLKILNTRLLELADTKPGYVLDNLIWILRYETRVREVNRYLPHAILLSLRVGNLKRVAEYTIMASGGQVARAALGRIFD